MAGESVDREGGDYRGIIGLIALTQLIITSDFLMISVALPSIGRDFPASADQLSWVIAANALTFAGLMAVGGRLADLLGRRVCFFAGASLFGGAALLSAGAPNLHVLIAARALQGTGTALLAPANFSFLNTLLPEGRVRDRAFGIFGMVQAGSLFLGLLIGGLLITVISWRVVFALNVPLLGIVVFLAWRIIPRDAGGSAKRKIDVLGALLVITGTALAIRALEAIGHSGWNSGQALLLIAFSLGAFLLLFLVERRIADPLLPQQVFGFSNVIGANLATLFTVAGASGFFVVLNVYLQHALGFSALKAGLSLMPYAVGILLGGLLAARNMGRRSFRANIMIGTAGSSVSLLLFQRLAQANGYTPDIAGAEMLVATGTIFGLVTTQAAATRFIPIGLQGVGSALQLMAQQFGTALGAAVALGFLGTSAGSDVDRPYHLALLAASALVGAAFMIAWSTRFVSAKTPIERIAATPTTKEGL